MLFWLEAKAAEEKMRFLEGDKTNAACETERVGARSLRFRGLVLLFGFLVDLITRLFSITSAVFISLLLLRTVVTWLLDDVVCSFFSKLEQLPFTKVWLHVTFFEVGRLEL